MPRTKISFYLISLPHGVGQDHEDEYQPSKIRITFVITLKTVTFKGASPTGKDFLQKNVFFCRFFLRFALIFNGSTLSSLEPVGDAPLISGTGHQS